MAKPRDVAGEEALDNRIIVASTELGRSMDSVLPLKFSWFRRVWSGTDSSRRILVPDTDEEGVFTRAWLDRPIARAAIDSPISLLTDKVTIDPYLTDQSHQLRAINPQVAAIYSFSAGLDLPEDLGITPFAKLVRIYELGSYVSAIAKAELYAQLAQIPSPNHDSALFDAGLVNGIRPIGPWI